MRHTFASWAIAAGLPTFEIATTMGTSLEQLSKTYAHLLPDSADRARVALDAFLQAQRPGSGVCGLCTDSLSTIPRLRNEKRPCFQGLF